MANNNRLKAFVRYDGLGRVIAGSLILQKFKPKVGNWVEIDAYECCNPTTTTTSTSSTSTTTSSTTTTTTTSGLFSAQVLIGNSDAEVCSGVGVTVAVTGNGTTLCNSTEIYSNEFGSPTYDFKYIAYEGQYISVILDLENGATDIGGGCQSCPPPPSISRNFAYGSPVSCIPGGSPSQLIYVEDTISGQDLVPGTLLYTDPYLSVYFAPFGPGVSFEIRFGSNVYPVSVSGSGVSSVSGTPVVCPP